MADTKITALTAIGANPINVATFPIPMVDLLDNSMAASGTTKKVTVNQILGAGGTATLASATITGDLTVDTNVLKVDTTNNLVGIGTASPAYLLDIADASFATRFVATNTNNSAFGAGVYLKTLNGASMVSNATLATSNDGTFNLLTGTSADSTKLSIGPTGIFTFQNVGGVAGTAMTLNSTGLGVGVSPAAKIHVKGTGRFDADYNLLDFYKNNGSTRLGYLLFRDDGVNFLTVTSNQPLAFYTNNTEQMRIDTSGNVGIGVTPSASDGTLRTLNVGYTGVMYGFVGTSEAAGFGSNYYYNAGWKYRQNGFATNLSTSSGKFVFSIASSGTAGNLVNGGTGVWTDAMTLDASGNLNLGVTSSLINTTRRLSVSGTVAAALQSTGAATVETINVWHTATSGNNIFVDFDTEAAVTSRGSISYNRAGGLVAYNTTSDYRAKDIIGPVSNSGSLIDSLKVYVGKMKGATIERPMLIAHEAQEVAPYAVTGTKDEVDADGKPKYQQMDASALVPLLIAEIQSLRARVQTLETR